MFDRLHLVVTRRCPTGRRWPSMAGWALAMWFGSVAYAADGLKEEPLSARSGPPAATLFTELGAERTGIVTENRYADPEMWGRRFSEFETGAIGTGVAIGDVDNDGRPDIFVVSKTESCRLFRNLGNWKFEDVTEKAGVGDHGADAAIWKQGVTFVDVNNDGLLDIYVCRFNAPNLLYINQGDGTFKEEAAKRGLAVKDSSVMAAFGDYDRDGWLDVFVQTNLLNSDEHPAGQRNYLFHNNGDGTFTDVTAKAGITGEGQGHSAVWWDFDGDGWPDLYVANDFAAPDKLYRNNHDGTFTNVIDVAVPHMPYSSMGSDLGDVNNDGLIDFYVADMAATTHQLDQRATAVVRALQPDVPDGVAVAPQYSRNALYLNTGTGRCLEAAHLAGLAATDWTWAVRLEDLDDDGRLDLFVTNGMNRESHNADMTARKVRAETPAEKIKIERDSPEYAQQHFAFRSLGDLRFEDASVAWGLAQKGVSFGAAFGDLDGDGDLDLVYSNYQRGVTVLRNDESEGHRIIVALRGTRSNRFGIGATVRIESALGQQVRPLTLARGLLSSSEPVVHFGLGKDTRIDRLTVEWPSGIRQVFTDLAVDRRYTIGEEGQPMSAPSTAPRTTLFRESSAETGLSLSAREITVDESVQQSLLPMRLNRRGPAIAVGRLERDAPEVLMLGGTPQDPMRVIRPDGAGHYASTSAVPAEPGPLSDGPVLLFEANGDGHTDLLQTRGGVNRPAGSPDFQPTLWLGDGKGGFVAAPADTLPPLPISIGAVAAADFDHSGHLGVFLGGRVVPGNYPEAPRSALWANRGGRFEDVTAQWAPSLATVGMVTGALWSDVDGDGWPDLLLTLEWGQVRYFHNAHGHFEDWTDKAGFGAAGTGWWNSIASADFNGDGRPDFVVGNVGLNTPYHADSTHPAILYSGDFKGDGGSELIEAYFEGDKLYPWRTRKDLGAAIPSILRKFPRNDFYARATLEEILGTDKLAAATRWAATELRSGIFLSQPDGTYHFEPLPRLAQIAPIYGIVANDLDGDGNADLVVVQNSYAPIPSVGRFDGGLGLFLRGDGHGHFDAVAPRDSGVLVPGDAKVLAMIDLNGDGWPDLVVSRNNSATLAFEANPIPGHHYLRIRLHGDSGNPTAVGARVTLAMSDGSTQTAEVSAGSGYFSQSTAGLSFGWPDGNSPRSLHVRWPSGAETTEEVPVDGRELDLNEHGR
ncbi:MAG TPA: FG-GAP-like repeat-containing protein [Candidatus Didemnitutus sp.]|nr:FG-GAP-like repeat-containing protein [Candidatus Didemnitutus sp.]